MARRDVVKYPNCTLLVVFAVCVLCWLPFGMAFAVSALAGITLSQADRNLRALIVLLSVCGILLGTMLTLDPTGLSRTT